MIRHYCDICNKQIIASCDLYTLEVTPINVDSIEFNGFECCTECLKRLTNCIKDLRDEAKTI